MGSRTKQWVTSILKKPAKLHAVIKIYKASMHSNAFLLTFPLILQTVGKNQ